MTHILCLLAFLAILLLYGCSSSAVYSPTAMLPSAPLTKEEGQLTLGVEMMPEARPEAVSDYAVLGGTAGIRYAFSDRLTLGGRFWADLESSRTRGGFGGEAIIMLTGREGSLRFGLVPRIAWVFNGNTIDGGGVSIAVASWIPISDLLTPYVALGPGIGTHDMLDPFKAWGYGLIGNLGVAIRPIDQMQIALELAGVMQINVDESITSGVLAPGISTSWMF